MNRKRPIKFLGFSVFVIFSAPLLLAIFSSMILLLPIRSAFADSYSNGYDEGCYDAGRDLKGLNGHGYDESVHHGDTQFRTGYVNGYRTCWNSGVGGGGGNYYQPQPPQLQPLSQLDSFLRLGPNWRQICNDYDRLIIEPCGMLVTRDGYALTSEGVRVLACFAGGALALVYPQLFQYSFLCGQGSSSEGVNRR
jgi:hypothetical protein